MFFIFDQRFSKTWLVPLDKINRRDCCYWKTTGSLWFTASFHRVHGVNPFNSSYSVLAICPGASGTTILTQGWRQHTRHVSRESTVDRKSFPLFSIDVFALSEWNCKLLTARYIFFAMFNIGVLSNDRNLGEMRYESVWFVEEIGLNDR